VDYFRTLSRVVEVLERSEVDYAYKPFPGKPADPAASLVKRGRVLEGMPFSDLIWAFDAFVFDIPSTPMFEAMLTDRPILVMVDSRSTALRPEARAPLQGRAELAEDPGELAAKLEAFLTRDLAGERNGDREFLRLYGTHLDDGASAERAARALIDLAR
jgi:CDP-glycerol glycerophosphotransferase (TagB/SpsB family)